MITIYHLERSRSERIIWLMEELGLPYALERFTRQPNMLAPDSYRAVHPLGRAPIISDGDIVLIESGAIVDYVVTRYGDGRLSVPPGAPDYPRYLQWLHFAEGSAMTQFLLHLFLSGYIPGIDQSLPIVAGMKERTAALLKHLDAELAKRPYFAGDDFTAADIMMMYSFGIVRGALHADMALYPHLSAYIARIEARPAYQKAMAITAEPAA